MSASNWTVCPRCKDRAEAARAAKLDALSKAYGSVPLDEYEAMKADVMIDSAGEYAEQTFREDYEIYGASSGTVKVSYSGHCTECGLGTDFEDARPFYDREAAS